MNTGEAMKVLIDAGWVTKEEAKKMEDKANDKVRKARSVAERALVDYLCVLIAEIPRSEHEDFVESLFNDLEKNLKDEVEEEKPRKEEDEDVIAKFLKAIGAA